MATKKMYVLGAKDPEMDRSEQVLTERGLVYIFAMKDSKRVHAGNAYVANNPESQIPDGYRPVFVECEVPAWRIDHHRPNDPGYGIGSEGFWEASSLGQLYKDLRIDNPSQNDLVLAAMDHCFNAAMQGKCPGVTTEDVLAVKVSGIAKATGVESSLVKLAIANYRGSIPEMDTIQCDGVTVMLVPYTGIGYTLNYLCAQVAAVQLAVPVIITVRDEEGGTERLHLCGDVTKKTAEYFMRTWAPENSLTKIYGSPDRGYAGGYTQ